MKNVENIDGTKIVVCNYCLKDFKWSKFRDYDTYRKHVDDEHPT